MPKKSIPVNDVIDMVNTYIDTTNVYVDKGTDKMSPEAWQYFRLGVCQTLEMILNSTGNNKSYVNNRDRKADFSARRYIKRG